MRGWLLIFLNAIDVLNERAKTIASYAVVILIIFLFSNVILRYFFKKPLVFTEEVTGYFLAFIVFMGLGHTLRVNGHVITNVLVSRFSIKTRKSIKFPIIIGGIIYAIFLNISAYTLLIKNYRNNAIDFGSLGTPEWIPNIVFVVGSILFLLEMVALLFRSEK